MSGLVNQRMQMSNKMQIINPSFLTNIGRFGENGYFKIKRGTGHCGVSILFTCNCIFPCWPTLIFPYTTDFFEKLMHSLPFPFPSFPLFQVGSLHYTSAYCAAWNQCFSLTKTKSATFSPLFVWKWKTNIGHRKQEYSVFHIFIQHALIETVLSFLPTKRILYMKDFPRSFGVTRFYISSR